MRIFKLNTVTFIKPLNFAPVTCIGIKACYICIYASWRANLCSKMRKPKK